jgi:O-antigen/teichoic acid export membrane protein
MFMIIMSKDVIRIVLGEQWVQAGAIFAVLGISGLIQPVINANGWLYVSVGRTDRMFKWGIFSSVFTVLSFFIGLPYGAIGVATSYTVVTLLLAFPCLWYAFRFSPVDILSVAKALWPTVAATLIVGVALIFFKTMFPVLFAGVWGVVIGFGITVGVFLSVLCGLVQSLKPIQEIIALLSQIFPQKNLHKKDVN